MRTLSSAMGTQLGSRGIPVLVVIMTLVLVSQVVGAREKTGPMVPAILSFNADGLGGLHFTADEIRRGREVEQGVVVLKPRAVQISLSSNTSYTLSVLALSDSFRGGEGEIPVSRLEWRVPGGQWTPLSSQPTRVVSGSLRGIVNILMDLRLTVHYVDPPGDYVMKIMFIPDVY